MKLIPAAVRRHPLYQDLALLRHWRHASPAEVGAVRTLDVERRPGPGEDTIRLRMLGPGTIHLRRGTSDTTTAWEVVAQRAHMPPPEVGKEARLILDLGTNIGLTMAHYAVLFPKAEIRGVELDPGNAEVARRNTAVFGNRCKVTTGAVWFEDGTLEYGIEPGHEIGASVSATGRAGGERRQARAYAIESLLDAGERVDFMKVDIEGAEREVFRRNTGWASKVAVVKVEVHSPYTVDECRRDLEALGFRVRPYRGHWACVVGVRP